MRRESIGYHVGQYLEWILRWIPWNHPTIYDDGPLTISAKHGFCIKVGAERNYERDAILNACIGGGKIGQRPTAAEASNADTISSNARPMREEVKGLDDSIAIDCRDIVVDECWSRDILYDDTDVGHGKGEIDKLGYIAVITNSRNDDDAFKGTR